MKKITMNLLAGVLVTGLLVACSSESTTGVETNETNTENNQSDMTDDTSTGTMTDTAATDTTSHSDHQNPPTNDNTGNRDQN